MLPETIKNNLFNLYEENEKYQKVDYEKNGGIFSVLIPERIIASIGFVSAFERWTGLSFNAFSSYYSESYYANGTLCSENKESEKTNEIEEMYRVHGEPVG